MREMQQPRKEMPDENKKKSTIIFPIEWIACLFIKLNMLSAVAQGARPTRVYNRRYCLVALGSPESCDGSHIITPLNKNKTLLSGNMAVGHS